MHVHKNVIDVKHQWRTSWPWNGKYSAESWSENKYDFDSGTFSKHPMFWCASKVGIGKCYLAVFDIYFNANKTHFMKPDSWFSDIS